MLQISFESANRSVKDGKQLSVLILILPIKSFRFGMVSYEHIIGGISQGGKIYINWTLKMLAGLNTHSSL